MKKLLFKTSIVTFSININVFSHLTREVFFVFFTSCPNKIIIHVKKTIFCDFCNGKKLTKTLFAFVIFWLFTGSFPKRFFRSWQAFFRLHYFFSNFLCSIEAEILRDIWILQKGEPPQKKNKGFVKFTIADVGRSFERFISQNFNILV